MKNLLFVSVVFSALSVALSARAADMLVKAPPVPTEPLPYNWSGLYAGVNFGGTWTNGSLNIPGNNFYAGITEFIGGVQAGYNIQSGHLLFGVEGQFDGATFDHPALLGPTLGSVSQYWIGTVAGRAASLMIFGSSTASLAADGRGAARCSMRPALPGADRAARTAG